MEVLAEIHCLNILLKNSLTQKLEKCIELPNLKGVITMPYGFGFYQCWTNSKIKIDMDFISMRSIAETIDTFRDFKYF